MQPIALTLSCLDAFLYLACLWDKRLSYGFLKNNLGIAYRVDNTLSCQILKMKYRPAKETLRDSVQSLLDHNLMERKFSKITLSVIVALAILVVIYILYKQF